MNATPKPVQLRIVGHGRISLTISREFRRTGADGQVLPSTYTGTLRYNISEVLWAGNYLNGVFEEYGHRHLGQSIIKSTAKDFYRDGQVVYHITGFRNFSDFLNFCRMMESQIDLTMRRLKDEENPLVVKESLIDAAPANRRCLRPTLQVIWSDDMDTDATNNPL